MMEIRTNAAGGGQRRTVDEIGGGQKTTGSGSSGATGDVPDPNGASFAQSLASALAGFAPVAGSNFEVKLAAIMAKMKEITGDTDTDRVVGEQESKKKNMEANQAKLEEAQTKLEEAEAKKKAGGIFNRIAQAFQALGAALMIALGSVLVASGAGAALGAVLIAGGVLTMLALVDSLVTEFNDGKGMFASAVDGIAKAAGGEGLSDGAIAALNYTSMAIGIVASIALAVFSGGSSMVTSASALAAKIAEQSTSAVRLASTAIQAGTAVGSGLGTIGSSSFNIASAVDRKDATELTADSQEMEAFMKALDDLIDQALQALMAASDRFNAMIDGAVDMMKDTGDVLSNQRFTA